MKLIVQIPCYNEENTLPQTLKHIPRKIDGIDTVEIMVINDGSTDRTSEVARENGVHHIIDIPHIGLAGAFSRGIEEALRRGADILVNTDADNQYPGEKIPELIKPILDGKAEIVIGCRDIYDPNKVPFMKRLFYRIGAWVVNFLTGMKIKDPTSGFRAFSKEALLRLRVATDYSYTVDTVIQAAMKKIPIETIEIKTNETTRPSRLYKNIFQFIWKQGGTIIRVFAYYRPLVLFSALSLIFFAFSLILGVRYIYYMALGEGKGHIQSVIASGVLFIVSFLLLSLGIIADMLGHLRSLVEDLLYRERRRDST